jgi:hypothetical protein
MVPGFPIRASIPVYPGSIVPTEFGFQHIAILYRLWNFKNILKF